MHTLPIDVLPLWVLLILGVAGLFLAMEGGYRFGLWRKSRADAEPQQAVGGIVASILGLVALLLGFTFNLAALRFDARRMIVLEESNAIGTTWLRTRFLPEPQQVESTRVLREYVDARLQGVQNPGQFEQASSRSEALQRLLWEQASAAVAKDPHSISTGLYIESLNEVIDLHAKRLLLGTRSRIPVVLWLALSFLSLLGVAVVGYQMVLTDTRHSPAMIALVLAFACVLYLIADLDRGQEGLLHISQQSMIDLKQSMQEPAAPKP
jgi:hypothetical protein